MRGENIEVFTFKFSLKSPENVTERYVYISILSTEKKINCSPNDIACIEKCSQSGNCSCPPGSVMSPDGETCVGECFNPAYSIQSLAISMISR